MAPSTENRPGFWQQAHGGTLFLDELANMPEAVQMASLRILQQREVRPLGATSAVRVDVDVVSATHRDLSDEVRAGRFKTDLYYRLAGERVTVPPLRERREEIPWLVQAILEEKESPRRPSVELMAYALSYEWPGNVHELQEEVGKALRHGGAGEELSGKFLPNFPKKKAPSIPRDESAGVYAPIPEPEAAAQGAQATQRLSSLEEAEREAIGRAWAASGGNVTRAAEILGIARGTLREKMRKYGL